MNPFPATAQIDGKTVALTPLVPPVREDIGYWDRDGVQIYYVRHPADPAAGPLKAKVLLAGPMAIERQTAYITWLRWARLLASNGFEALHFDYSGMGESSGRFADFSHVDWLADTRLCFEKLKSDGDLPVILMGFRLGAGLAAHLFAAGCGDALLTWDLPKGIEKHLMEILRRKITTDIVEKIVEPKTRDEYWQDLKAGGSVDVEGYLWQQKLIVDAEAHPLQKPGADEQRSWQNIRLIQYAAKPPAKPNQISVKIPNPPFWGSDPFPTVLPDVSELFEASLSFVQQVANP